MPRPIETLLSLPRVRLIDRVPILETKKYVKRFMGQPVLLPLRLVNTFSGLTVLCTPRIAG